MKEDNRFQEALVALFGLGLVAFSPLILDVFDGPQHFGAEQQTADPAFLFGVPLLYLYLFAAWGALVILMALVVHRAGTTDGGLPPLGVEQEADE